MLAMLLQSLLGVSDDEIIDDYHKSNDSFLHKRKSKSTTDGDEPSSAATAATVTTTTTTTTTTSGKNQSTSTTKGRLDRNIFSGTNPEAMVTTLQFLRQKYGSVSPGYLDEIGFNESWRRRLISVFATTSDGRIDSTTTIYETDCNNDAIPASSSSKPRSRL
jgi:hypothetical protein